MKKSHMVTILNQKLMVRSDASDESVAKVAALVSSKIQDVMEKTKSASILTATLLTCLNMADEFERQKEVKVQGNTLASEKVREILHLIEEHLQQGDESDVL